MKDCKLKLKDLKKPIQGLILQISNPQQDILIENIVKPLEKELQSVRRELSKFRKAIEKVKSCKYEDECPVKEQLYKLEDHDDKNVG